MIRHGHDLVVMIQFVVFAAADSINVYYDNVYSVYEKILSDIEVTLMILTMRKNQFVLDYDKEKNLCQMQQGTKFYDEIEMIALDLEENLRIF